MFAQHPPHLRGHQHVVRSRAGADADRVHGRQRNERKRRRGANTERPERDERSIEIARKENRDRGQRPAVDDEQQRDAVEESDDRMVGALKIRVLTADLRVTRRQLGPDERADQRDHPAERPHDQNEYRIADEARDIRRVGENPNADDATGHDHDRVEQPELAAERRHRVDRSHADNRRARRDR